MQSTHDIECWVLCMDTMIRGMPRAAPVSAGRIHVTVYTHTLDVHEQRRNITLSGLCNDVAL
eukprot:5769100-Pleurochrysis_carterae.AAC.1